MKNIKLIIDMSEDLYKGKIRGTTSNRQDRKILECVKNGTPLEDELEKIKAEIDGLYSDCLYGEQLVSKTETMGILDNHISELKGE